MNQTLENFAREQLKQGLSKCSSDMQHKFKQMYAHGDWTKDINEVVDIMPVEKLDWAMSQVENTIKKFAL